jgi:hypothetical protein
LHAGDGDSVTRDKRRSARDVPACFADRIDTTKYDIIDKLGV